MPFPIPKPPGTDSSLKHETTTTFSASPGWDWRAIPALFVPSAGRRAAGGGTGAAASTRNWCDPARSSIPAPAWRPPNSRGTTHRGERPPLESNARQLLNKVFSVAASISPRKKTHLYRGAGRIREPVLPPLPTPLHGQGGVAHPVHLEHLGKAWEPPLLSTAHPQQAPEENRLLWKRNNMYPWG